ncbi:hypothetical protein RHSP_55170 [Rhizobium freirei PRF 81]|uniref:Uncharacterized protein n=1 Tax=Rhizobium freirei PRF 81 TaxID=363754 RepID=N6UWU2_9HYPH|nr:hypothetical protein RHSP_55170 [Rhizobium freirei PRF 81]
MVVRAIAHREAALRGDDGLARLGRTRLQPAADDLLRLAGAVDVGGVDEVAAPCEIIVEKPMRRGLVRFRAESHGAKAIGRDDGPAWAELAIIHSCLL